MNYEMKYAPKRGQKRSFYNSNLGNSRTITYSIPPSIQYAGVRSARLPAPAARRGFAPVQPRGVGLRGETKAVDFATTVTTIPLNAAAGNAATLNLVQAGSSFFNRIGRKIAMQSLYFNADFIAAIAPALNQEYIRVMIVYDCQTNGASPIWSDVVQATTQNNATSSLVKDGFNLNNRDRFKILLDQRFLMPALLVATGATDGGLSPTMNEMKIQEFRKLGNLETQYGADSAPAVIGDVRTGGVFLMVQGDVGGQWNISWTCRIRYTDN